MSQSSVSYSEHEVAGGGGGHIITQPFSPADNGRARKEGSKNNLARFLARAGVKTEVASKVGELSVTLFKNMDVDGLYQFVGDDPMERAIMRSAQLSLKAELESDEKGSGSKRRRDIFDVEEGEEEEDGVDGMDALAMAAGRQQVENLRKTAMSSRRQPRSEVHPVYGDPYMIGIDSEGKEYMLSIYGEQDSDGTSNARRMASLRYNVPPPKGAVILRMPQLNIALVSYNKTDTVKRGEAAATVILTVHPSRWASVFQNDWDIDIEGFQKKAFEHWALESDERTVVGWTGIEKLKLVEGTAPLKSVDMLSNLLAFKWTVIDGLTLSLFENTSGESRSLKATPCGHHNSGVVLVIKRLSYLMIAFMSDYYDRVFAAFIMFITENDKIGSMGGDQIAFNFNSAMVRVSNAVGSAADMRLGNGTTFSIKGPFEVAEAITASMEYQINLMRSRNEMRNQKEDFHAIITRQTTRAQGGSAGKPASRDVVRGPIDDPAPTIKQPPIKEDKKLSRGGKGDRTESVKGSSKVNKCNFLCVGYLGETLEAMAGGQRSKCIKGDEKCYFTHRKASWITRIEAEEALLKPVDSEMNRAIKQKIAEYNNFKK
jgi:hypothetical protein